MTQKRVRASIHHPRRACIPRSMVKPPLSLSCQRARYLSPETEGRILADRPAGEPRTPRRKAKGTEGTPQRTPRTPTNREAGGPRRDRTPYTPKDPPPRAGIRTIFQRFSCGSAGGPPPPKAKSRTLVRWGPALGGSHSTSLRLYTLPCASPSCGLGASLLAPFASEPPPPPVPSLWPPPQ
jgi:hypothetical protein